MNTSLSFESRNQIIVFTKISGAMVISEWLLSTYSISVEEAIGKLTTPRLISERNGC